MLLNITEQSPNGTGMGKPFCRNGLSLTLFFLSQLHALHDCRLLEVTYGPHSYLTYRV